MSEGNGPTIGACAWVSFNICRMTDCSQAAVTVD